MIKKEWASLFKNKWLIIVTVAIIAIPSIYSTIFLGSIWDPYGSTGEIPVAVVNEDKETTFNNVNLNVGKELANNLKKNDAMNFQLVNANKANQGLKNGDYYMVITIPDDFSKNATTLLEDQPNKMILNYKTNPGTSYIASKMDDSAINKIKEEVSSTVTQTYAKTIFEQFKTIGDGMNLAVDGSKQINDGTNQLLDGNNLITTNLKTLADSTLVFKDGADTLKYGLQTYLDGVVAVNKGSSDLNNGLTTLDNNSQELTGGMSQINAGLKQLQNGSKQLELALTNAKNSINSQLNNETETAIKALITPDPKTNKNALESLNDGIQLLNNSFSSTNANSPTINDSFNSLETSLDNTKESLTNLNSTYLQVLQEALVNNQGKTLDEDTINKIMTSISNNQTIKTANSESMKNITISKMTAEGIFKNLQQTINVLATNSSKALPGASQAINQLYSGLKTVQAGLGDETSPNTLINGANSLYQGTNALNNGFNTLNTGLNTYCLGVNSAKAGASQLFEGTNKLVTNNPTITNGVNQLTSGASQIADGANQLFDGSNSLNAGLLTLQDGTNTLTNSLADGADEINSIHSDNDTYEMMASPVKLKHQEISTVENNGHGMAPYMMSVGLYVACMAFTLMYPLFNDLNESKNSFKYWLSKASVWFSISSFAAIAMIASLMIFCDFAPQQLLMTFVFAVIVGAAFMALITLLSSVCGKIGEFILLVFMVINLGASAGTYPLETSASIFKAIHPFVPFTYSVDGFRKVISMNNVSIYHELIIFVGIIVICSLLTILVYRHRIKKPTPLIPQAFENVNE